ncbi:MAG TPA: outer membrane protein transport protein [Azospirillum sp.]|nr:outer membrane protein transport protein [Azospirillum sp.]
MIRNSLKTHLLAAAAVAALAAPITAHAAGFQLKEQSVSGQGTSFAGVTAGGNGDASAMFFNPAAMGLVQGNEIVGSLTGILPYSKIENARATRAQAVGGTPIVGNANPGDAGQDALLPAGYGVYSLNPDVKLGLAVTAPWGLITKYPGNWVGRYHGITSDLQTINIQPTVSYRVAPTLTVGGGLQFQRAKARLTGANDAGLFDIYNDLEGDDWGWGGVAGVMFEPAKGTRLGLSYRSAVKHELSGDVSFSGAPFTIPTTGAHAKLVTPEIVSFGAYQDITDRWAVMADVTWTNWSRFRELAVFLNNGTTNITEERWKDSWFFSVGTSYKVTDALTLRGGVAYDKSPIPDEFRTPRIPDEDRFWVSIGAGYKVTEALQLDAAYTHIFVRDSTLNLTDDFSLPERGRGNLSGKYKNHVDIIGVQARYSF